ncbi:MAG: hypothetical protein Q4G33_05735 [bacterium]|nr:hypothetical protein [bacterium]
MKRKRNLSDELNLCTMKDENMLDINIVRIKGMVHSRIDTPYMERKFSVMKSRKKFAVIAAAAVLAVGATVFAGSGVIKSWSGSSSSKPDYTSLPTAQQCIKDIGYEPVLIDSFANGYSFDEGSIVTNNLHDENDNTVESFKSISLRYKKDGDKVSLSQEKFNSYIEMSGETISGINGTDIYYVCYENKFVPPGYEMTEEDKKAEENGELVFSWGSDEVELHTVQSVSWVDEGMHFDLMQMDGNLSKDDMTEMANEIISR